jgi:hypothetical protein
MALHRDEARAAVRRTRASEVAFLAVGSSENTSHPLEIQARWLAARKGLSDVRARLVAELAFKSGGST